MLTCCFNTVLLDKRYDGILDKRISWRTHLLD